MRIIFSLIVASALFLSAPSANAEQFCAPRDRAVIQLEKQFGELVSGRGLAENGRRMIELLVSEKGYWTVLISDSNGRSCVMASGESWQGKKVLVGDPA
jgi:hypothetical protein